MIVDVLYQTVYSLWRKSGVEMRQSFPAFTLWRVWPRVSLRPFA